MPTIATVVQQVAPRIKPNYMDAFQQCDALFAQFGITTPLRIAHFLAQVMHETGGGTVLHESLHYTTADRLLAIFGVGNHSAAIRPDEVGSLLRNEQALAERVYGLGNPTKAKELGNTRPGDGYRYRGSGMLQTTGGANFKRMGDKAGVDFYNNPDLIVAPEHALKPALHEWAEGNLNAAADADDIRAITRRINGGFNGLADRQAWFRRIWPLVSGDTAPPMDADRVRRIQQIVGVPVDGVYGPGTRDAVILWQAGRFLVADGIVGPVTAKAMGL